MTSNGEMTAARREYRFLLDTASATKASEVVRWHCRLSDQDYFTPWRITTYWDTSDLSIYRLAEEGSSLCLRFREYRDERPEEMLTSTNIWVEFKESAARSRKQRVNLAAPDVIAFLTGSRPSDTSQRLPSRAAKWIAAGARPVLVTRYRRVAYEGINDTVRVTVDDDLTYLATEWNDEDGSLVPCAVGPVVAAESGTLIEIKSADPLPTWANDLVESLKEHVDERPSKFVLGMRHVLEHPAGQELMLKRAS